MEISSFPFLNQDEVSHLYSLLVQDLDAETANNRLEADNNLKNRRRNEGERQDGKPGQLLDEHFKKDAMRDILASLIMLDEEEMRQQQQWIIETQQDKALFDSNQQQRVQCMNEFRDNLRTHYSDMDEIDHQRSKRARRSAASPVVALVAENAASSSDSVRSGLGGGRAGVSGGQGQQHRRLWVKDRSKDWWDRCNHPDFPDEEFRKEFRMSKATFEIICGELESAVTKKNTMLRDAIPVRQRVAVCIWRLATGHPLRLVSKQFGLGISTCHKLVLEVCSAIKTVLMPKFLQWPDEERLKITKTEFQSMSGIPDVGGSMYTTHVPIIAPKIKVAAYFNKRHTERNQKTSYSITVQGVVDSRGVFTDVCIGWPGSMPDDQVLEKSALYQRGNRGLLKDVWIVGNPGFPLLDWVLVPYTHQNLTWAQHTFNEKIEQIQGVAKDAFARLKGRWACLQKRTDVKLQDLPVVLGACCVLHNICESRNEAMDPELNFELFDDEVIPENNLRSVPAIHSRDHIAHSLLHHGLAGTSGWA